MGILHHLSITADNRPAWDEFLAALADGDSVVILDRAVGALLLDAGCVAGRPQVRWLLPSCERRAVPLVLPAGIVEIEDHDWWQLIATHPVLLEWS